ncbi:MAG: FAD-dependent oxidoreductase [Planctomycetota bacterium]|nr:MAG: FAD-dependent oxidoreductase [Planctomycetota bacterium]REK21536.1 MAG: FAD-dependent oxidoreductase [Planctomycetota bacterium]REK39909.1 MAG: FAD-dependent oxidoreductase [Planctomycetota bacterium]
MRIAIIGSGISGLVAAHQLHGRHEITLFEANDYIGGHTNTVDVGVKGRKHCIDTGFIVFNEQTYPEFSRLLNTLGVTSRPTSMSFSVSCRDCGLEYNGTSLNGLFAQRTNLLRPGFHRMLRDILRFNREADEVLAHPDESMTVGEYVRQFRYSRRFAEHYLLPMGAAIWSCPVDKFERFPIRFIVEFYRNHGLLSLRNRPVWRVIEGGSRTYVEALTAPFRDRIRLQTPIGSVLRGEQRVLVREKNGKVHSFDEIIFACHSDQALGILGSDATEAEREILSAFPYEPNTAVLHTDESLLPRRKRAWASWNYRLPAGQPSRASVTYNMNILQHIESRYTFCVTLNAEETVDPRKVLGCYRYSHPVYTTARAAAQRRQHELIRAKRTSFCGAYWGYGFHEDGVRSAQAVCRRFEAPEPVKTREAAVHA